MSNTKTDSKKSNKSIANRPQGNHNHANSLWHPWRIKKGAGKMNDIFCWSEIPFTSFTNTLLHWPHSVPRIPNQKHFIFYCGTLFLTNRSEVDALKMKIHHMNLAQFLAHWFLRLFYGFSI